jgi:hypothetical protein
MDQAESKQSTSGLSGKLLIIGILTIAFLAAGTSWWFRYNATRSVVKFWGPEAATIIRDAPVVTIYHAGNFQDPNTPTVVTKLQATELDISNAHGLTHLRNALLEDHNFDWATLDKELPQTGNRWGMMFADPKTGKSTTIWLSDDFQHVSREAETGMRSVAVDPIMATGLREMFGEFSAEAAKQSAANEPAPPAR